MLWNIQGLTDKLQLEHIQQYLTKFDIILLSETWIGANRDKETFSLPGYEVKNFPRPYKHTRAKRDSGGLLVFIKNEKIQGVHIIESLCDHFVILQCKQSYFGFDKEMYIIFTYIVPEDTTYICACNNDVVGCLENTVAKYIDRGMLVVCGDLNARTGTKKDTLELIHGNESHPDFDAADNSSILIPARVSKDTVVNARGRDILDICKSSGLLIMNGRLYGDEGIGNFTRVGTTGSSVVDYVIVSRGDVACISNFRIDDSKPESDHKPLAFCVKTQQPPTNPPSSSSHKAYEKYLWQRDKIEDIADHLTDTEAWYYYEHFLTTMIENKRSPDVADAFMEYLTQAALKTLKKKKEQKTNKKFPSNSWFDAECKQLRAELCKKSKSCVAWDNETNEMHKRYKSVTQRKKRAHKQSVVNEITNSHNTEHMWNLLKSLSPKYSEQIPIENEDFCIVF